VRRSGRRDCGQERGTLRIGDHVTYEGRLYVVLGLDPMGVPGRRVDLEDLATGERRRVPLAALDERRD
jgi:hypothetical protein